MKNDNLIDAALREHARLGTEDDQSFLDKLEQKIDAQEEVSPRGKFQIPYLSASAAVVTIGIGAAWMFQVSKTKEPILVSGDTASASLREKSQPEDFGGTEQVPIARTESMPPKEQKEGRLNETEKLVPKEPSSSSTSPVLSNAVPSSKREQQSVEERLNYGINSVPRSRSIPAKGPQPDPLSKKTKKESDFPYFSRRAKAAPETWDERRRPTDEFTDVPSADSYSPLIDQGFKSPSKAPLSTFSIDVDTASYTNARKAINAGSTPHRDSVRVEEMINYFSYDYPKPAGEHPLSIYTEVAACPWNEEHRLVRVGIQAKEVDAGERKAANLVFLIDVSGSMSNADKLPLLTDCFQILLEQLNEEDRVSFVVYAGRQAVLMQPTSMDPDGRALARKTLQRLNAGGGTNGAAGITTAYELARQAFRKKGVNRVILATDGDFNVGLSSTNAIIDLAKKRATDEIYLTVLGFGRGNLNDALMEKLTNEANGNYFYLDSLKEGQKVFQHQLSGTLETVAKDTKIQVEFNPGKVSSYRLIGYANRRLKDDDFDNDKVDAGDVGAGHQVTALYEVVPIGITRALKQKLKYQPEVKKPQPVVENASDELLTVNLRYKIPGELESKLLSHPLTDHPEALAQVSKDFRFASSVALWGMLLRDSPHVGSGNWDRVKQLAAEGTGKDRKGYRMEFRDLVRKTAK